MVAARPLVVVGLLAVVVAGCGGGGSGGSPAPAAAPAATAPAPAATAPDDTSDVAPPVLDGSKLPQGVPGDLPDGTYRLTVSQADLATLDLPEEFADTIVEENVGVYTWRLAAGRWHMEQAATPPPVVPELDGTYIVDGDQVTFYFPAGVPMTLDGALSENPPAAVEEFRWTVDGGVVRLTALDGTDPLPARTMASHPWQPVADGVSA